jgi:uncharacterized iron-regulated protein
MRILLFVLISTLLAGCATPQMKLDEALRSRPIVLLGEVHDNAAQHGMRAEALRRLLAGGARPALLMEQFDRDRQAAIDAALAQPGATPQTVIAAGWPNGGAGWNWAFYAPFIQLAIDYRLPLLAANVSRADARGILAEGLAARGFDGSVPPDVTTVQAEAIGAGHCGMLDDAQARRMVPAQVARDQFMARLIEANAARGVVLLAGNGHVRSDAGVPRWLPPETRQRSVSIGLLEAGDDSAPRFDVALATPAQPRTDPCAAMRR